jgi:hypothetical protein
MAAARASALDALTLDAEIEALLFGRWQHACGHIGGHLGARVQPEARAILRTVILYLSSCADNAGPGQALLRLRRAYYAASASGRRAVGPLIAVTPPEVGAQRASRSRTLLYGCLTILLPWVWTRLSQLASRCDDATRRWRLRAMRRVEGCIAIASLLVTLRFLHRGVSPSLPMLLVGMQLVHALPRAPLPPAFDFMEQQVRARPALPERTAPCALMHPIHPRAPPVSFFCRSAHMARDC